MRFSIFLVNQPGVVTQIFQELGNAKINILNVAMIDTMEHGVLRLVTSDHKAARPVLKNLNIPVTETDVLTVTLGNHPGAAADLCDRLSVARINIGYMYCTSGARGGKTRVILKVPDIKKAISVLDNTKPGRRDMKVKLRRPVAMRKR